MSQRQEQKHSTISEVAADWHELMITTAHYAAIHSPCQGPTMQPADIPPPQSATLGPYPVARKLLLISAPTALFLVDC